MSEGQQPVAIEREKVHLETSQIAWKELQRFFASGQAITVSDELDLIEVAYQVSKDNKALVEQWMSENKLGKVSDSQAIEWFESDALLWTVVIKPWVLVQFRQETL